MKYQSVINTNKFSVNKPLSDFSNEQNIKIQHFVDGADEHKIEAKPNKLFPVPLNEYELSLLQQVSQNLDKSQRYTSRMILVKALIDDLIPF